MERLTAASEVPSFSPFNHWETGRGTGCSHVQIEVVPLHGGALALAASGDAAAAQVKLSETCRNDEEVLS